MEWLLSQLPPHGPESQESALLATDGLGRTPLMHAAASHCIETFQNLLERSSVSAVAATDGGGHNSFHHAAKHGFVAALRLLISRGSSPGKGGGGGPENADASQEILRDPAKGASVLALACASRCVATVRCCLERLPVSDPLHESPAAAEGTLGGCSSRLERSGSFWKCRCPIGESAIVKALEGGSSDVVGLLLALGIPIDLQVCLLHLPALSVLLPPLRPPDSSCTWAAVDLGCSPAPGMLLTLGALLHRLLLPCRCVCCTFLSLPPPPAQLHRAVYPFTLPTAHAQADCARKL